MARYRVEREVMRRFFESWVIESDDEPDESTYLDDGELEIEIDQGMESIEYFSFERIE